MRALTEAEVKLIAGGYNTGGWSTGGGGSSWSSTFTGGTITVTGNPGTGGTITVTAPPPSDPGTITVTGWPSGSGDPDPQPEPTPTEPQCDQADNVTLLAPPDNAKYYVPEGMTAEYLNNAINHLTSMARGEDSSLGLVGAHERVLVEFKDMYTNPGNPFFVDFKDWGNAGGPAGSEGSAPIQYHSDAAGTDITASPYEAFGNFFYGFLGTLASISPDELYAAAAYFQEGGSGTWSDAPEDQPHVNYGIQQGLSYAGAPTGILGIENGNCSTGVTGGGTVG